MTGDSEGVRRYGEEEVARILKRATEIRSRSTSLSRPGEQEGLTLRELEEIAAEAGIDVAHVRRAAVELDVGVDAHGFGERFVGAPWTLRREAVIEGELGEDAFQAVLSALQVELSEPGFPSLLGRTLNWKNETQKGGGRSTMVTVTSRAGRTTIRVEENLQQVAGGFHGGITVGGGVGIGLGLGLPVGIAQASVLLGVGLPLAGVALAYAVARTTYRSYVGRRSRVVARLLARLVEVAEKEATPPGETRPPGG